MTEEFLSKEEKLALKHGKFYCTNCKKEKIYVLVDGYSFGDRLLEGVNFMVTIINTKYKVACDNDEYFESLNRKKWIAAAYDYVEELDFGSCPACGEDISMPFYKENPDKLPPAKVTMGTMGETILTQLFGK